MPVFFDTETDSLIANSARAADKQPMVVEIYAIKMEAMGGEPEEFHRLLRLRRPMPKEAVEITGITEDLLKEHGVEPSEAIESFIAFMKDEEEIVAHNLSFDMNVIEIEAQRLKLSSVDWPIVKTCTVEETEHIKGHRLNLSALHEYLFGEAFDGAHRAEADVRAMARCYWELKKRGEL